MKKSSRFLMLACSVFFLNGCDEKASSVVDRSALPPADTQELPASSSQDAEVFNICAQNAAFSESRFFLENMTINPDGFENYPEEVKCFTENAALCEHFGGEEAYDESRRQEILQALSRYCGEAQKMQPVLKTKYSQDSTISKVLAVCDEGMSAACSYFGK